VARPVHVEEITRKVKPLPDLKNLDPSPAKHIIEPLAQQHPSPEPHATNTNHPNAKPPTAQPLRENKTSKPNIAANTPQQLFDTQKPHRIE
jgi:hypothetical protein